MDENLAGFWYAVFQPDPSRDRLKVWLDGDDNYQLFRIEDFIKLARQTDIGYAMSMACRDYSFFMWDVAKKTVNRISFKESAPSLRDEIANAEVTKEAPLSVADQYWKQDIQLPEEGEAPKFKTR